MYRLLLFSLLLLNTPFIVYGQSNSASSSSRGHVDSLRIQAQRVDSLCSMQLGEVIITATQPNTLGTRSVIARDAIRHIQATALSDLMQLLPGALTHNPNLNTPALFTIRSATYSNVANALGTAIVVDGLQMSNNTNLQQVGLDAAGALPHSTVQSGFDVRQLSPTSIESVEVIRGVPSARYGDVTSGVVLVQSKIGIQPLSAGLRFTATEKTASAGKGFEIGKSTLYLGTDYALSSQDPRLPERDFRRIAFQGAFARDFASSTLRLHLRAYRTEDRNEKGPNTLEGEYENSLHCGFSLSVNGRWHTQQKYLTTLEYSAGVSYAELQNKASTYRSGTQQVTTYTQRSGEQEAIFLPPNYFSYLSVEGCPLNSKASLTAHLRSRLTEAVEHHLQVGIEAATEGNRGKGITFAPLAPPAQLIGARPRSYRNLPFVHHLAAFAEKQFTLHIANGMRTELQAGLRLTHRQYRVDNLDQPASTAPRPFSFDPRLNLRQVLIEKTDRHLSLRIG